MQVVFSESINYSSADVIVIVANDSGRDFIENKIKVTTGSAAPKRVLESLDKLKYKEIKSFDLMCNDRLIEFVIIGAGKKELTTKASIEKLGGYIFDAIKTNCTKVCIYNNLEVSIEAASAYLVSGITLKSWTFDKYKTKKNTEIIESIECETSYSEINETTFGKLQNIIEGVSLVKTLVTEPANFMNPEQMLEEALSLKKHGIKVSVLERKDMEKLGMNAILGVGKGSDMPTYLITMEYRADKSKDVIALVGKGLTFDTGGICLKPSTKMSDMKGDMTGAAVVMGTLKSLALQEADVNVVGVIGVVENVISGTAQKPGDVVVSMSGKTIEVDNTDAEGRLVLADVLWYTKEKYAPKVIIDLATLTGAIQVALGHEFAGLFSNSDELSKKLEESGTAVGEKLWRLPLHPSYEDDIKSDIADIKNVGSGRGAGSITAAMFLQQFVPSLVKWAHLDIAATEWDSKHRALSQKGATGFGVRLLNDFIGKYYGKEKA